MDNITYIILLKNQSKNIESLAESLRQIQGNFRKEYIIVDDFSSDNTMEEVQKHFASFSRATFVVNDEYHGPSYSINKALSLAHGKYIHFVDGDEILAPESTLLLYEAIKNFGTNAAFGLSGAIDKKGNKFKSSYETGDTIVLDDPVKNILENNVHDIRKFGFSGSMASTYLLEEMGGLDEHVFTHNISLALNVAKNSKFAYVKKTLCFSREEILARYSKKFEIHDSLLSIVNFMEDHAMYVGHYTPELYKALWSLLWNSDKKHKVKSLPRFFLSRYMKRNLDVESLIELYKGYIEGFL